MNEKYESVGGASPRATTVRGKNIGIEMQSVIRIPYQDLKSYSGEPVILPVNIYVNWLPLPSGALFSDSIYPVFLGVSFPYEIDDHLATWLKHWEPIGCRDEDTYRRVVTKGIDAYIAGCLTITLPERKKIQAETKFTRLIHLKVFILQCHPK